MNSERRGAGLRIDRAFPHSLRESPFVGSEYVAVNRRCPQRRVAKPALNEMRRDSSEASAD
jgi:hypothetical protein